MAQVFTDDRKELLKAIGRQDNPLSATEISRDTQPHLRGWLMKQLATAGGPAVLGQRREAMQPGIERDGR
jgi:hypothetical protein